MSVHSTYYEDEDEYERDLRWEYRKGNEENEIPFYGYLEDEDMEGEDEDESNTF